MSEAVWRGNRVKVLTATTVRAVIITPLGYKLAIRAAELRTVTVVGKPKYRGKEIPDSRLTP